MFLSKRFRGTPPETPGRGGFLLCTPPLASKLFGEPGMRVEIHG
jgi:hypothetical protein